jgi:uncharacterized protein (TIGR02466 family)
MPMRWDMPVGNSNPSIVIELARKATALHPDNEKSWELLGRSLLMFDKEDEAIAALTEAVGRLPRAPKLHFMLADAYYRVGRIDLVDQAMHRAPTTSSDDRETTLARLAMLMKTGIASDAVGIAREALALDPTSKEAIETLGLAARRDATPEIMIPICQAALRHERNHVRARYELAIAHALLGHEEEARRLIDLDRFVTLSNVVPPAEYAHAAAFESALTDEISRNPTLKSDPAGKATKGGLQTSSNLAHTSDRAIGALLEAIRSAVDAFTSSLSGGSDDPFVEARPEKVGLDAWAVVYPGDGHQVTHIHPSGWLSGVYCVGAPKASGDDPRGGCLVLGSSDLLEANVEPPWGIRDIRPAPGKLVLFPSYIPHATLPTKSSRWRISIAFDVVPLS